MPRRLDATGRDVEVGESEVVEAVAAAADHLEAFISEAGFSGGLPPPDVVVARIVLVLDALVERQAHEVGVRQQRLKMLVSQPLARPKSETSRGWSRARQNLLSVAGLTGLALRPKQPFRSRSVKLGIAGTP